ncbi:nuclear transport factor 2 family protein [Shewanella waksmanii]|uniref:nuclear transport factor 2 family protein n=1 Tax=Shewanella waksmanii TaxID=213783 RepID=UPI003736A3ED
MVAKPLWLENFIAVYEKLGTDNLVALDKVYHSEVVFLDPMHRVEGLNQLLSYFDGLYENLLECSFTVDNSLIMDNHAAIYWTMTYRHTQLNGANPIVVEGHSLLKGQDNKVIYHRDYLDVGAMLYEHIPVLGFLVRKVKQRAGG